MAVTRRVHVVTDYGVCQYPENDRQTQPYRPAQQQVEMDMAACITNGERIVQVLAKGDKFIIFTEDYGLGPRTL